MVAKSHPSPVKTMRSQSIRRPRAARHAEPAPDHFPVVAIGASAGGLEAGKKLLDALPANTGMAFILVQHLDPTHESLMVDLLAGHTSMPVCQAVDGMTIEPNHLYIIAPGTYLSVANGRLRVTAPQVRHGARLPFDYLLKALAEDCGARIICVILSGTGTDGCIGLQAVKEKGGLVIAQDPDEAGYEGMPRNAIATGAVDHVLSVAEIPEILIKHGQSKTPSAQPPAPSRDKAEDWLPAFIDLLRTKTVHDFKLYKPGTLQRRIERRMAMVGIPSADTQRYLEILSNDANELDLLSQDILINVTSFFRDPNVFEFLAEKIIPELVGAQPPDQPLRIWIAGCSTGEETYSLAMLFREEILATKRNVKLQVFASDVDPDAITRARDGVYPESIATEVSPERLAQFFIHEANGYRIAPELRAAVVFTVQDVLADPPFSRLDLVSCRNLLIYLRPEAQAKVLSLFHFALRGGGFLLLGNSETAGNTDGLFKVISKAERVYQHIGRRRPVDLAFAKADGDGSRAVARPGQTKLPSRQAALAELCNRLVMEAYAPAAILINKKQECLYSLGPTDRYLRVAPGNATHDLLSMARRDIRIKLRTAIQQADQEKARVTVTGGRTTHNGAFVSFNISALPIESEGEELLLICFIDEPNPWRGTDRPSKPGDASRVTELEAELDATRMELQGAIRNLEVSGEEQRVINEEALSVNEEYQSTNEELETSKEELQSLNEELTALNSQLQETLERQRTLSNDVQNILYSTNVATLFLDTDLNIRFFTPATRSLFRILPGDIGRPLEDLSALASDGMLLSDARTVLKTLAPLEREIEGQNELWFLRRILPYLTQDNQTEGVVITFVDMTERRHTAQALEAAKRKADLAVVVKSRFLAAANHDLRQPLQTLALLQGLLAKAVVGEKAQKLVAGIDETLVAITGMLNTLLDINQIEAGVVRADVVTFPINELLSRLRDEFDYHAKAQGLELNVVPCSLSILSDPSLLEQMIRNLISNALKYTKRGKVLIGCRRRGEKLSIEIWDTGVGIPENELQAIFDEYYQLDNTARERSRGLGLGLSIVQRLGVLLGHPVSVRSKLGKGSVFIIEVTLPPNRSESIVAPNHHTGHRGLASGHHRAGEILIVEDDPEVSHLLKLLIQDEGHRAVTAPDGVAAMSLISQGSVQPDLILADYNLPNGLNGLQLATKLRETLRHDVPVIILTGDTSNATSRNVALQNCMQLHKPVKVIELSRAIQSLLTIAPLPIHAPSPQSAEVGACSIEPVIYVVDDDDHVRAAIRAVLEDDGRSVQDYATCEAFLEAFRPGREVCLLIDAYLPGMSGLELLDKLHAAGHQLPAVMITGNSDVHMAVQAMKAGASDFIEKPISREDLVACVERALEQSRDSSKLRAWRESASTHVAGLTVRQRQIMDLVLAGHPSKNIAADLGISQRTVENHRAAIMKNTGAKSLPALARLALAARWNDDTVQAD